MSVLRLEAETGWIIGVAQVPLLEDKKEAVRVRAAAGYLRLEAIKSARRNQTVSVMNEGVVR